MIDLDRLYSQAEIRELPQAVLDAHNWEYVKVIDDPSKAFIASRFFKPTPKAPVKLKTTDDRP